MLNCTTGVLYLKVLQCLWLQKEFISILKLKTQTDCSWCSQTLWLMVQSFNIVFSVVLFWGTAHTHTHTLHVNSCWMSWLSYLILSHLLSLSPFLSLSLSLSCLSRPWPTLLIRKRWTTSVLGTLCPYPPPQPTSSSPPSSPPPSPHSPSLLHHSSDSRLFSHQPLVYAPIITNFLSLKEKENHF